MAERIFESDLEAWFADAPPLPDSRLFAARVTRRLDRAWTLRRVVIGGLGLIGGVIGGAQMLSSGLFGGLARVQAQSTAVTSVLAGHLENSPLARSPMVHDTLAGLGAGGSETLLMSAALALLAVGLLVTRAIREI